MRMQRRHMSTTAGRLCPLVLIVSMTLVGCSSVDADPVSKPSPPSVLPLGAVRYVSPGGQDTWPGTRAQPWGTLTHALTTLQPGQQLYVRGGDYREKLVKLRIHRGTPTMPIVVKAYPQERPIVHGLVWLRRPSYWTIDGLNVTWNPRVTPVPRQMVKLTGGVGWTWQNSEIWGSRGATNLFIGGLGHRQPADWSLTDNCIHDVDPPGRIRSSNLAIGEMDSHGPGSVTRNLIFNAAGRQNVVLGSPSGGPTNLLLAYNTVYGSGAAVTFAGGNRKVAIYRNMLGGVSSGLLIRSNESQTTRNVVSQNLGVGADRFLRPQKEQLLEGPGNVVNDGVEFSDVSTCQGFHTEASAALPYGRDAVSSEQGG